jgi:hypothetical protein
LSGVGVYEPVGNFKLERDAYSIALKSGTTWVELKEKK